MYKGSSSNKFRKLPSAKDSLYLYVLRSNFQSGWAWGKTLTQECEIPSVQEYGCILDLTENHIFIKWKTMDSDDMQIESNKFSNVFPVCKCTSKTLDVKIVNVETGGKLNMNYLRFCGCKLRCKSVI